MGVSNRAKRDFDDRLTMGGGHLTTVQSRQTHCSHNLSFSLLSRHRTFHYALSRWRVLDPDTTFCKIRLDSSAFEGCETNTITNHSRGDIFIDRPLRTTAHVYMTFSSLLGKSLCVVQRGNQLRISSENGISKDGLNASTLIAFADQTDFMIVETILI